MNVDIVKSEPRTELELFERRINAMAAKFMSNSPFSKKIEIKQIEKINCKGRGRLICEQNGEHSWFNHSMDKAY